YLPRMLGSQRANRLERDVFGRAVFPLFLCFPQFGLRASRGNEDCRIIPSKMKTELKVVAVALMTGVALVGLSSCQRQQESALKPIDKAALQTMVDTTARELLIPGVVVLLRTPQGEFTVSY